MAPNSLFVDALIMYLRVVIFRIFIEKSWFGLVTNYKRKCVRKPILVNLGSRIFKNFSPVQTVVVFPGEVHISKLFAALCFFMRLPFLIISSEALLCLESSDIFMCL